MIVKRIRCKRGRAVSKPRHRHATDTIDYINLPHKKSASEHASDTVSYVLDTEREYVGRVVHSGGVNFVSTSLAGRRAEMAAHASSATRSNNPIRHYVMSWPAGERPTRVQADLAAAMFLARLGLSAHQALWAMHDDSKCLHLHLVVNRTAPGGGKVVTINRGFDLEVTHQAIAEIEHAQGWAREPNGRYEMRDGVPVMTEQAKADRTNGVAKISATARDFEWRTAQDSNERFAIEKIAPVIRTANSWQELHTALVEVGAAYITKGSGAVLRIDGEHVKASTAGRDCSHRSLVKRIGVFVAPEVTAVSRQPRIQVKAPRSDVWHRYLAAKALVNRGRKAALSALRANHAASRAAADAAQCRRRKKLLEGDWSGLSEARAALTSVIAYQRAVERATMTDVHKAERKAVHQAHPPIAEYEEWLLVHGLLDEQIQRRRRSLKHARQKAARFWQGFQPANSDWLETADVLSPDIRSFVYKVADNSVEYARAGEDISFRDCGTQIELIDTSDEVIVAAMQLGAAKWGRFVATGGDEFQQRVIHLAKIHRLPLVVDGALVTPVPVVRAKPVPVAVPGPIVRTRPIEIVVPEPPLEQRDLPVQAKLPVAEVQLYAEVLRHIQAMGNRGKGR